MENIKKKSIKGFFWDFIGKIANQGISFIISIFLARLLLPSEFGLIGIVLVIVSISQVLMDMGLSSALIQKKEVTKELLSSAFWINLILGIFFWLICYILSSTISTFFNEPKLAPIIEVVSLLFPISSLGIIQQLLLKKELNFKKISIINIGTAIISGILGIILAYQNYGVWALVIQRLSAAILNTLLFWFSSSWTPVFYFSINTLKPIWNFSSKQFLDSILSTIYQNLDIIIIGKLFNPTTLGFYTRAKSLDSLVNKYSSGSLKNIFFPLISQIQNDIPKVKSVYKKSILLVSFVGICLTGFLFLVSDELFVVLFTNKWSYSSKLFKIMAVVGFTYPISSIIINLIIGLGYARENLVLGLWKKLLGIITMLFAFFWDVEVFLYACILRNLLGITLNIHTVSKIIDISIASHLKWLYKPLLTGTFLVFIINYFVPIENDYVAITIKGGGFICLFIFITFIIDQDRKYLLSVELDKLKKYVKNRYSK